MEHRRREVVKAQEWSMGAVDPWRELCMEEKRGRVALVLYACQWEVGDEPNKWAQGGNVSAMHGSMCGLHRDWLVGWVETSRNYLGLVTQLTTSNQTPRL